MSASENKDFDESSHDANQGIHNSKVFIIIVYDIIFTQNMNLFAVLCCDEVLVKIFADEEEVEQAERMANWAAIKDLVEEDANEKRKLIYSPGICQGSGQ